MSTAKYHFYIPHERVTEDNLMVDPRTGELVPMPSMTKQSFVEECDINNILKEYKITGQIAHISAKAQMGVYADLPDPIDFQESMNTVLQAEESFATLPSQIRQRFGNDPAAFLEFMADPSNKDEIYRLGLAKAPEALEEPVKAPTPPPGAPTAS